jgi:predicted PurR-regulated permease PerM
MSPSDAGQRRLIILGVLWLTIVAVLITFRTVVLPFASAALIAYLVAPLVDWITRLPLRNKVAIPRWVAILMIYVVFFSVAYLAILLVVPQIYRELARISREAMEYVNALTPERVQQLAMQAEGWLSEQGFPVELSARSLEGTYGTANPAWNLSLDLQQMLQELASKATGFIRASLGDIVGFSGKVVGGVLAGVFMTFFMLMLAAYMSIDIATIRRYLTTLVPAEFTEDLEVLVGRIDRSLAGVVRGQFTICLVNGMLTFIGLLIFGVKFAVLLATVATLLSLIPIFGSIISSVPIVAIGLSQSWKTGLWILLWIIGIHALEAYFLNPKIMGTAARIHPLVVAFALIAGERSFGLIGALFAVPIAAILVGCFDYARQKAQASAVTQIAG